MKKIFNKNYILLLILLVLTVFITLLLSNIYLSKNKLTSEFYQYSNKIGVNELEEYIIENSDTIIYISDKYDLTNEIFEKKFIQKINEKNLKSNLIYIDVNDIDKNSVVNLKKKYNINLDLSNFPVIIVLIDKTVVKNVHVDNYSNVDEIINYEVFE